jgi:hypothetical protein
MLFVYKERLQERQACVEARLAESLPKDVTEMFCPTDMALPHDLIDTPPVRFMTFQNKDLKHCCCTGQRLLNGRGP